MTDLQQELILSDPEAPTSGVMRTWAKRGSTSTSLMALADAVQRANTHDGPCIQVTFTLLVDILDAGGGNSHLVLTPSLANPPCTMLELERDPRVRAADIRGMIFVPGQEITYD